MRGVPDSGNVSRVHRFPQRVERGLGAFIEKPYGLAEHIALGAVLKASQLFDNGRVEHRVFLDCRPFLAVQLGGAGFLRFRFLILTVHFSGANVLVQHVAQLILGERLGQIIAHPGVQAAFPISTHRVGGQRDDGKRQVRTTLLFLDSDAARRFIAVHNGHLAVHEYEIVIIGKRSLDAFGAVHSDIHLAADALEHGLNDEQIHRVVFDDEHVGGQLCRVERGRSLDHFHSRVPGTHGLHHCIVQAAHVHWLAKFDRRVRNFVIIGSCEVMIGRQHDELRVFASFIFLDLRIDVADSPTAEVSFND